jgi:hypothetical protein
MTVEELLDRLVKPLVWRGEPEWDWTAAQTSFGDYHVKVCDCGGTECRLDAKSVWHSETPDRDGCKDAAEADYRARIAAALDPAMLEKIAAMMGDEG